MKCFPATRVVFVLVSLFAPAVALAVTCEVKVNGVVVKSATAATKSQCASQLGLAASNCVTMMPWFTIGMNTIEVSASDVVSTGTAVGFGTGLSVENCVFHPPMGAKLVDVGGLHYPKKTCAESRNDFAAGVMTSAHFRSKCSAALPFFGVFGASCEDAPRGFSSGSVWKGTAVCAKPIVIPAQAGTSKTPCPPLNVVYARSDAPSVPYVKALLPALDAQCASAYAGSKMATVSFIKCAKDARGEGFGPVSTLSLTCSK